MGNSFLEKIENKVYWGIVGALLTIAFGILGLYTYFHVPKPSITFEIVSESNVLDVHKRLENLTIYFKNEDIQKKNLNLRIITVQISNNGEVDILQSYFDQKMKWGFKINDGKIINDARIVSSNSEYLKANLSPKVVDGNMVEIEKTIFEKGKYFSIELLVLHKKDLRPEISYMGKIVGIDNVTPVKTWEKNLEPSFIAKFFYGGYMINVLRPIVNFIVLIGLIIIIAFSSEKISDIKKKVRREKRKKEIDKFFDSDPKDDKIKMLTDIYVHSGLEGLKQIEAIISDDKRLKNAIMRIGIDKEYWSKINVLEKTKPEAESEDDLLITHRKGRMIPKYAHYWGNDQIDDLIDKKVVELNQQEEPIVDANFKDNLARLLLQLKNKSR